MWLHAFAWILFLKHFIEQNPTLMQCWHSSFRGLPHAKHVLSIDSRHSTNANGLESTTTLCAPIPFFAMTWVPKISSLTCTINFFDNVGWTSSGSNISVDGMGIFPALWTYWICLFKVDLEMKRRLQILQFTRWLKCVLLKCWIRLERFLYVLLHLSHCNSPVIFTLWDLYFPRFTPLTEPITAQNQLEKLWPTQNKAKAQKKTEFSPIQYCNCSADVKYFIFFRRVHWQFDEVWTKQKFIPPMYTFYDCHRYSNIGLSIQNLIDVLCSLH